MTTACGATNAPSPTRRPVTARRIVLSLIMIMVAPLGAHPMLAQAPVRVEPGSPMVAGHRLKPHRVEFDELLFRDADTAIAHNRFYIQLTHGMKYARPVYYMWFLGMSATNSGWDIIRFARDSLAIQNRGLQIGEEVAVINYTRDSVYGNYPSRADAFAASVEDQSAFDLNIAPYVFASMDLRDSLEFEWPVIRIKTGKVQFFRSRVAGRRSLVLADGRKYDAWDVVTRRPWSDPRTGRAFTLSEHHYVSPIFPYYLGRDWYVESEGTPPHLWHRWSLRNAEVLTVTAEQAIQGWVDGGTPSR